MKKHSTIIKVDIRDFNEQTQPLSAEQTADFLETYYAFVVDAIAKYKWRMVKTMGDGLLISVEGKDSSRIRDFYDVLRREYNASCQYRHCEYEEREISIGEFKCLDVFGKDINNLFLHDEETVLVG